MPPSKITAIPFRSSNLTIPPSPFSPRSPLTPAPRPQTPSDAPSKGPINAKPPAVSPLRWRWQCHQCEQIYPLGVTRRCLEDGHNFCSGISVVKSRRHGSCKVAKKHRPCASEFDYAAWKALGRWRHTSLTSLTPCFESGKDCWHKCNYPSECRWGKKPPQAQMSPTVEMVPKEQETQQTVKQQQMSATEFSPVLQIINTSVPKLGSLIPPVSKWMTTLSDGSSDGSCLQPEEILRESYNNADAPTIDIDESTPPPATRHIIERVAHLKADVYIQAQKPSVQKATSNFGEFDFEVQEDTAMAV